MRPGVFEARARALCPVRALTKLLLPTLERPANAASGKPGAGKLVKPLGRVEEPAPGGEQQPPGLDLFGRQVRAG